MCKGRSWYARFCLASKGIKLRQLIRGKEKVNGDPFPRLFRTSFQDLNFFLFYSWISDTQPLVNSIVKIEDRTHCTRETKMRKVDTDESHPS